MSPGELSPAAAKKLAHDVYIYGFAMVENYNSIFGVCIWEDSPQFSGFNNYLHVRELYDPDFELIVNANNDTLHSSAFLDLGPEPRVVTVPPTGDTLSSSIACRSACELVALKEGRPGG